jgi:hypothetical protein
MSSSKKINKSVKRKVNVEEVEAVEKKDRRGRIKMVMQRVKHPKLAKKETPMESRKPKTRRSPSPVACGSVHGSESAKQSKVSKVCNLFACEIRRFQAQF